MGIDERLRFAVEDESLEDEQERSLPPLAFDEEPPSLTFTEKRYFKIGEVAEVVGVEPHVLRYWETQFPGVRPHKAKSGHRLYRRRDLEVLLAVRDLVHVRRFTIAGARQALRQPGAVLSLVEALRARAPRTDTSPMLEVEARGEVQLVEVVGLEIDELKQVHEAEMFAEPVVAVDVYAVDPSQPRQGLLAAAIADARDMLAILDRAESSRRG